MRKYTLYWYYRSQICRLNKQIEDIRLGYAERSNMSSRNFEFEHLVNSDSAVRYKKERIYKLKRKMCVIK